jgi:hypothetical protein
VIRQIAHWLLQIANCKLNKGVWLLAIAFPILAGCGKNIGSSDSQSASENTPTASEVELGPVKLTAEIMPSKARLSDQPTLTLTTDAESGVECEWPPFGDMLGAFKIVDTVDPLRKTRDGREIRQRILTLEPTETCTLRIDPIPVVFRDKRNGAEGKSQTIITKAIPVEITSSYTKETPSLGDARPAADPVAVPWRMSARHWTIAACLLVAVAAGIAFWRWPKTETTSEAILLTPEELARRELNTLAESGWSETDVKMYFVELTAIVRRYIERTTGIHAPEQTTEEFLREMSRVARSPHASAVGREASGIGIASENLADTTARNRSISNNSEMSTYRLREFLESADLVKFAAFRPRREDIDESFRRAEAFVGAGEDRTTLTTTEALA